MLNKFHVSDVKACLVYLVLTKVGPKILTVSERSLIARRHFCALPSSNDIHYIIPYA